MKQLHKKVKAYVNGLLSDYDELVERMMMEEIPQLTDIRRLNALEKKLKLIQSRLTNDSYATD